MITFTISGILAHNSQTLAILRGETHDASQTWAMESSSHYPHTAGHSEVPETHRLILRAGSDHPASPRVQRQDVSWREITHCPLSASSLLSLTSTLICAGQMEGWSSYLYVHWGRADPVLSGSLWCRCYSLRPRHWSRWLLHFQAPPWRPGLLWYRHAY